LGSLLGSAKFSLFDGSSGNAMSEHELRRMTPEEFFEWQKRQDRNYELVDGVPVLPRKGIIGLTEAQDAIQVNAIACLHTQLRATPCRVFKNLGIIVPNGNVRRTDAGVDCGPFRGDAMEAAEPRVLLELLAPQTLNYQRFQRLEEFKATEAIRVILLIDTEAPQLTVWRREDEAWGRAELIGLDAVVELPEIGVRLPLADLYEGLTFETG
jgi:Uma2 family endonuclease